MMSVKTGAKSGRPFALLFSDTKFIFEFQILDDLFSFRRSVHAVSAGMETVTHPIFHSQISFRHDPRSFDLFPVMRGFSVALKVW